MNLRRRGHITILSILFALSMVSVSFSAWVSTTSNPKVNFNVNVGTAGKLSDFISTFKTKPIKYCKDGFLDANNDVNFFEGTYEVELHFKANEIRRFYEDLTKVDFDFSTSLKANASNQLAFNLINNKLTYSYYSSIDGSSYSLINNGTFTIANGVATSPTIQLDTLFSQNIFYLKLCYTVNVFDAVIDPVLGTNFNEFQEKFMNTADITKDLSKAKYDIHIKFGARS